jgi:hypothetical protein
LLRWARVEQQNQTRRKRSDQMLTAVVATCEGRPLMSSRMANAGNTYGSLDPIQYRNKQENQT